MTDYSELIKKLRDLHRDPRPASAVWLFDNQIALYDAAAAIEALQAQLPKLGEIVRCKECIHFTQGGWCDREFDWFPVDENDFCSMAEKMEVHG